MSGRGTRQCTAKSNTTGNRCERAPIKGGTVCTTHGGKSPVVVAKARVRAELESWGFGDVCADPGEVLLRLVTQSAARAQRYAAELEQLVAEAPTLRDALIGDAYGEFGKQGEYVRGLAKLEAEERDRCAGMATKAIAAGLAERQVRLAERQGALLAGAVRAILADLALTPEQQRVAPAIAAKHLRAITAGAA